MTRSSPSNRDCVSNTPGTVAAAGYFTSDYFDWQGAQAARSARVVVPILLELTGATSVVDLGGGTGAWASVFVEQGVDEVLVVDGAHVDRERLLVPAERFVAADLADPPQLGRTFELALSLEAAHYAPASAAAGIVSFLTRAAPLVYFSAAIPGQPGGPTRNLQWPGYWSELFAERGFRCADVLRPQLWERPEVDWWYAQNGLLFVHDDVRVRPTGAPLPLVHPGLLAEVTRSPDPDPVDPNLAGPQGRLARLLGRGS